jgi:hypothetical protein
MDPWLLAAVCGIAGAFGSELFDLHASLNRAGRWPWDKCYGGRTPIGWKKYLAEVLARILLGALAGMAAYGQDAPPGHTLAPHTLIFLAACGFAAPAILQKIGGAVQQLANRWHPARVNLRDGCTAPLHVCVMV